MLSTFSTAAVMALVFTSFASSSPVVTPTVNRHDIASLNGRDILVKRDSNVTILAPVTKASLSGGLVRRDTTASPIAPQTNITLLYASNSTLAMSAEVNVTMKTPSVVLEDIESVSNVECAASSVTVTFSDSADYSVSMAAWSNSSFILFTNHLGDCDTDNERGLYLVSSLVADAATLTIIASTTKSEWNSSAGEMGVSWFKPTATTSKRSLSSTILSAFPTSISLTQGNVTETLNITASDTSLDGSFDISGHLSYNFFKAKFTELSLEVDMSVEAATSIEAIALVAYDSEVYTYSLQDISVAAFEITGILSVGPELSFELGVEVAASLSVEISSNLTASLTDGYIYLDLLDSSNTITPGWTPVYTPQINISAAVEAQVNPYVQLTAEIGINFLDGLLNFSSGITAKPELLNVFDIDASLDISNAANITFAASTDTVCANSLWFASEFVFTVTAFVTQFYSVDLYDLDIQLYESGCWSWLSLGNSTES